MRCPSCPETTLVMTDRQGVEIDYCPSCRGIWLDRGELDKLLERAAGAAPSPAAYAPAAAPRPGRQQSDFEDSDYRQGRSYRSGHKKSWLSDIFD